MRQAYIPTISELLAFSACAETGATTRAAQKLSLTQSAISRSINSLETRLGVSLFDRVRQRLVLSDAGRALQRDAARILKDLESSAMSVMAFGGHRNVLRLAVLPSFARTWLIPKLANFNSLVPEMTFDFAARLSKVDFEDELFDAAVQRGASPVAGVKSLKLMDEYLVTVASPELVELGIEIEPEKLAKLPLLQQSTRPNLWPDWFEDAGFDSRTILRGARFDHFDMMIEAAIAGLGVALVPEILAARELGAQKLVQISKKRMLGPDAYNLVYPKRSQEIVGFEKFMIWITGQAGKN